MTKRYISIQELSEYIGITKGTLYVWVCYKRIPYVKIGKRVKFDLKEIDDWITMQKVEVIDSA
jgi:excisionase family DNA binding protein